MTADARPGGLPVVPYTAERVPNDHPGGSLSWQAYHAVRNALVVACRRHGSTGPMGVVRLDPDVTNPYRMALHDRSFWERGDPDPAYFVVADQFNHERYCYAEVCSADAFTAAWVETVAAALRPFDGWGLAVKSIPGGYLLILADRLMVTGRLARCRTGAEVAEVARRLVRRRDRRWWQFWR